MINLTTNKQLNIILNNTNKALAQVVNAASPSELKELSQFKDLKSIMDSVLQEASKDSSQNKALLNLVKNNPTLKNLGTTTQTVNDILNTLKSEKNPLPIEKTLQKFLVDIKDMKESVLKDKIVNSGVFLESKLKNVQNPQIDFKETLTSLSKQLGKSKIFNVTVLGEKVKELALSNPKDISNLVKKLQDILPKITEHIQKSDSINRQKFATSLTKLEHLFEPKMLTKENFSTQKTQQTLLDVTSQLSQSTNQTTKGILDSLSKIFTLLKNDSSLESLTQKNLPQELKTKLEDLKSLITKSDTVFSKEVAQDINKLTAFTSASKLSSQGAIKEILTNDLKAILHTAKEELSKLEQPKTELIKHIDKLALQIDHAQLLSHLSNATSLYLPFSWDEMKEGHINIKKENDNKFNVDIDLNLKEYGPLNIKLAIYDKNQLNVHIYSQNKELKSLIKENISELRSNLISQQITPREIRLFDTPQTQPSSAYEQNTKDIYMGFEVKV